MPAPSVYPRFLLPRAREALADFPALLIQGARQCGKTTLARQLESEGYAYISFDDDEHRAAALASPKNYVADLPEKVILDEVQRVPAIFTSLKLAIDKKRAPGRFILTGSANVLLTPKVADSLAGRLSFLRLYPLAQAELAGRLSEKTAAKASFVALLLRGQLKNHTPGRRLGEELFRRVAAGGYPAALAARRGRGRQWYLDYAHALIQRDVRELSHIQKLDDMPRLLELAAEQTAQLMNSSALAAPFQISRPTVQKYLELLAHIFLTDVLPPWHRRRRQRLTKTPKLHLGDTGLACALLGLDSAGLAKSPLRGHLLETFIYQELLKQASWQAQPVSFSYFRDRNTQFEADFVLESGGKVYGIEVKAAATLSQNDAKGLRKLKEAAGEKFGGGVVLHDGDTVLPLGAGIKAAPISLLLE